MGISPTKTWNYEERWISHQLVACFKHINLPLESSSNHGQWFNQPCRRACALTGPSWFGRVPGYLAKASLYSAQADNLLPFLDLLRGRIPTIKPCWNIVSTPWTKNCVMKSGFDLSLSLDPALGVHMNFGLDLGWGKFLVVNWTPTVRWKMQICKGCSGCKGCRSAEKIMMTRPAEYSNEPFIRSYSGRQEAITATCCPKSETSNENWPFKVPDCDI